tara:strand:+ start:676 stop:786 length:111 start_codon:yes stop_codon:yes gene_type:complete
LLGSGTLLVGASHREPIRVKLALRQRGGEVALVVGW